MNTKELEIIEIGPAEAKILVDKWQYQKQRPLRKTWVTYLNDQMRSKKFDDLTTIKLAHLNGHVFLIDGQHRLSALALGGSKPIKFIVSHRYPKDDQELAEIYARTDQGLKRSFSDIADVYGLVETSGIKNKTQLNQAGAAANQLIKNFGTVRSGRIDMEVTVQVVLNWSQYVVSFLRCVHNGELGNLILKSPVMALGMITFKHQTNIAYEFWHQVSYNDLIGRYDPRSKYHRFILEARLHGTSGYGVTYTPQDFALVGARCWNAYVNGEEIKKLNIPTASNRGYLVEKTGIVICNGDPLVGDQ